MTAAAVRAAASMFRRRDSFLGRKPWSVILFDGLVFPPTTRRWV